MKGVKIFTMFVLLTLTIAGSALALPVSQVEVKLNGHSYNSGEIVQVERDEELDISFKMKALSDIENVDLRAYISGYEYSDRESTSDSAYFLKLENGVTYQKKLSIDLPQKADKDNYKLRIHLTDRNSLLSEYTYDLLVDSKDKQLTIKDVVLSPETKVKQGRAMFVTARIKNTGRQDEESLSVRAAIPELGISNRVYLDELEKDDTKTTEEIVLEIPRCAEPKEYTVVTTVEFDEGYKSVSKESTIRVQDAGVCEAGKSTSESKTVLTVGPESQDIVKGQSTATYVVTLTNSGATSKTYMVSSGAADWASVQMTPSNVVVLGPNEAKAVYVQVSANEAADAGEKAFALSVSSGDKTLQEVLLKANVVEPEAKSAQSSSLKKGLEVGLVVLVVLLVVLGLIIGFNRLKSDEDDEDSDSGQTYY